MLTSLRTKACFLFRKLGRQMKKFAPIYDSKCFFLNRDSPRAQLSIHKILLFNEIYGHHFTFYRCWWYTQERIQMRGELVVRDGNWNGFYCNSANLCFV